jgi:hypothetical protein
MKMILTGMLIYIPPMLRAGVGALVCVCACCSLNFFRPHRSAAPFWLSQLSWIVTTAKYITALLLKSKTDEKESEMIGFFLIMIDVTFMSMSVLSLFIAAWILRHKIRMLEKRIESRETALNQIKDKHSNLGSSSKTKSTDVVPMQNIDDVKNWNFST